MGDQKMTASYVLGPFLGLIVMQQLGNTAMLLMAVIFAAIALAEYARASGDGGCAERALALMMGRELKSE